MTTVTLLHIAKRRRFESAKALNPDFRGASGVRICEQTVRNRLHAANIRALKPAARPPLTPEHRRLRLDFSQEHRNIPLARLSSILFTDESKFCVDLNDGRRRVWRQKSERFRDCCVLEHDRFGGLSVLVWDGISYDGSTDLYVIANGALTGVRYRDKSFMNSYDHTLVLWVRTSCTWTIMPIRTGLVWLRST